MSLSSLWRMPYPELKIRTFQKAFDLFLLPNSKLVNEEALNGNMQM